MQLRIENATTAFKMQCYEILIKFVVIALNFFEKSLRNLSKTMGRSLKKAPFVADHLLKKSSG